MVKHLIERTDTNQWLKADLEGEEKWTADASEAAQFETEESASVAYTDAIKEEVFPSALSCEITEHLFVDIPIGEVIEGEIADDKDTITDTITEIEPPLQPEGALDTEIIDIEEVGAVEEVVPEGRLIYKKLWGGNAYPGASPKANFELGAEAIRQLIVDGKIRFDIVELEGSTVQTVYLLDEVEEKE